MTARNSLDPSDWQQLRAAWDSASSCGLEYLEEIRSQPVWRRTPPSVLDNLSQELPWNAQDIAEVLEEFKQNILPYGTGNIHPAFFGWVHGGGNVYGAMGEMLAALMNCNVGGRDHVAVYLERQVLEWCKEAFRYPGNSSGILTSGTSMGTLIALTVARDRATNMGAKYKGLAEAGHGLVGYCSIETHNSVAKAFQLLGLGNSCLREIPVDGNFEISLRDLEQAITADIRAERRPFCVVATAGSANTGAIDDIGGLVRICKDNDLWLHVDAAFGGFAIFQDAHKDKLGAISDSDSIAFDFHKWLHVPYDAGGVLITDAEAHRASFSERAGYLQGEESGLAGGEPWFCDFGPELSRNFRALKIWFTIKACGMSALNEMIDKNCKQAEYLAELVRSHEPSLELLAPVSLNICCFRYIPGATGRADEVNRKIVIALQDRGIAAPSITIVNGHTAIRVAIVNHRTSGTDLDTLVESILEIGAELDS